MVPRRALKAIQWALSHQPAAALLGPRQVGKTTLARVVAECSGALYLDLEDRDDRDKLSDPEHFLRAYEDRLVVLDEIHRVPDLFQTLRALIDRGRRHGNRQARFLAIGAASVNRLHQNGKALAGRIAYVEMGPLDVLEVGEGAGQNTLWLRGGLPESFLAGSDDRSLSVRKHYIRDYLERDVAQLGPRIRPDILERFWTILAREQGKTLNASRHAAEVAVSVPTIIRYVDLLSDLRLVRSLPPLQIATRKRLVKSPRVYVRDSGIGHCLLGIHDSSALAGDSVVGASWQGFVIEQLLLVTPERTQATFYRTAAGAEIDLVLDLPGGERWAIDVELGDALKPDKGFLSACEDVKPTRCFIVHPGEARFRTRPNVEAIALRELAEALAGSAALAP